MRGGCLSFFVVTFALLSLLRCNNAMLIDNQIIWKE